MRIVLAGLRLSRFTDSRRRQLKLFTSEIKTKIYPVHNTYLGVDNELRHVDGPSRSFETGSTAGEEDKLVILIAKERDTIRIRTPRAWYRIHANVHHRTVSNNVSIHHDATVNAQALT